MKESERWAAAADDAERRLRAEPVLESLLLRLERGDRTATEDGAAVALACLEFQDADGSWQGSLLRTAELLLLLRRLDPAPCALVAQSVQAGLDWLQGRRDAPGALSRCCTPAAHALHLCEHFTSGFFSPAPVEHDLSGLRLECGQRLGRDLDARVAASALALGAVHAWGAGSPDSELHDLALERVLQTSATSHPEALSPAALACALTALLHAPAGVGKRTAVRAGMGRLVAGQRADGTWPELDLCLAVDVLLDASACGVATIASRAALVRAARLLLGTLRERSAPPRSLRAAVRAMRYLAEPAPPIVDEALLVSASPS